MEKKRSKGVTFWGWIFIIFGIIGLLNPQQTIKLYGLGLFFFSIVSSIATLITGIFVLKLNETARKAVIVLGVLGIISIPFWFAPVFKSSYMQESYAKKRQYIIEKVKPEYQQKALDDLDKVNKASEKAMPIIISIFVAMPIIISEILPIIFFTRPKVKEQFS